MEYRWFGTPVIGQSAWYQPEDNSRPAIDALLAGIDYRMTHIDTDEMCPSGEAEIRVGVAVQGRRAKVLLVFNHSLLPFFQRHHLAVAAYSPFGRRDFSYLRSVHGEVRNKIAKKHGATSRQLALRRAVRVPLTFTIVKAADWARVPENAGARELQWSEAEFNEIGRALALAPEPAALPVF